MQGDSIILGFHCSDDALKVALAAQDELLAASWPLELLQHPLCAQQWAVLAAPPGAAHEPHGALDSPGGAAASAVLLSKGSDPGAGVLKAASALFAGAARGRLLQGSERLCQPHLSLTAPASGSWEVRTRCSDLFCILGHHTVGVSGKKTKNIKPAGCERGAEGSQRTARCSMGTAGE
jgi:hypothetical protein